MIVCGISALSHDAAFSIVDSQSREILFASHSERFSRKKNDPELDPESVRIIKSYAPTLISWYERPFKKKTRQLFAGQLAEALSLGDLPARYLQKIGLGDIPLVYQDHHRSHAAAGYFTSPFDEACVVVIDAIGEWDTLSIWRADQLELTKVYSSQYPSSLGLLYSAFTERVGLKPNEEEFILMGMAAHGEPVHAQTIAGDFLEERDGVPHVKQNCHLGLGNYLSAADAFDLAASIQEVLAGCVRSVLEKARLLVPSDNLVYMGGVALNCAANAPAYRLFKNAWIMPNPGDAGSSLGAAALATNQKLNWGNPYLGYEIAGSYPVEPVLAELQRSGICGVASGRAEFGPRALGNRSLLADPRGTRTKSQVNQIKKREPFRPLAPAILVEHAEQYFELPANASELPYMQLTVRCKDPENFPAIVHADGTARVQTVSWDDNPGFHELLTAFHETTGCPMLLNTSLNIKGQPLVNTRADAEEFTQNYGVTCW